MIEAAHPLSVFDMLKVGIGPSSSHTLGPWRAVQRWMREGRPGPGEGIERIRVHLYGSLALTGRGHATDQAVVLALRGHDPETIEVATIPDELARAAATGSVEVFGRTVEFDPSVDIVFHPDERRPEHPNAMVIDAIDGAVTRSHAYFSIGGGFVVGEGDDAPVAESVRLPFPSSTPREFRQHCATGGGTIAATVFQNERTWRTDEGIRQGLLGLWRVMLESIHRGCHTAGVLPGGLEVQRRAPGLVAGLLGDQQLAADDPAAWLRAIRGRDHSFTEVLTWVSAFAMAVNEENAALGRVVTAPTNGAAGVVPAVLASHLCFSDAPRGDADVIDFLLVAGEIGTQFKKGATISAAAGGCQAEIGVSSAMAAAALTEVRGGTVDQALMAAEIATEHHLGLTCDPVGGLVQVPCIERNAMGAVTAINAAELALAGDPSQARVTLDDAIRTLRATAEDMSEQYKETSRGGLAVNVSVRLAEC